MRIARIFPTDDFPNEFSGDLRCDNVRLAVDLEAGVARCAETPKGVGLQPRLPGCEALSLEAEMMEEQMLAIWCAVLDCAAVWHASPQNASVQVREVTPSGPEGGCISASTLVTLTLGGCSLCA